MEAKRTPLIELLERVPRDAVLVVEHDQFSSSSHPVGRLCHEAAAALEAAREDAERMKRDIADLYKVMPMLPITAETMEAATDWFERYCIEFYREINAALDAAIDQARGSAGGGE